MSTKQAAWFRPTHLGFGLALGILVLISVHSLLSWNGLLASNELRQQTSGVQAHVEFILLVVAVGNLLALGLLTGVFVLLAREQAESQASELRHRTIIESAADGIFIADAQGRYVDVNTMGCRMLGYSREELLALAITDIIVTEETARVAAEVERLRAGQVVCSEWEFRRKDGTLFPGENSGTILPGGRMLGIVRDITERKRSEAIVACHTKVLEKTATGAPLAETIDTLLRLTEQFAPGMHCSVLLLDADGQRLRHVAAPSLPDAFNRAIDGESIGPRAGSCGTAAFRREAVIVEDIATDPLWADYRELALEHGLRACWSTPIFDEQQCVLGTFAIYYREPGLPGALHRRCIDLATSLAAIAIGKQQREAALHISESRYRRLVESNMIGVIIARTDGAISEANDCFLQMIGYTREQLQAGQVRWDTITPPEWRAVDLRAIQELESTGVTTPLEKEYFHKDGHRVPILAIVALLEGTSGDVICLIQDLTERNRAQEARQASEARYRKLFEYAPEGILIADPAGDYVDANATVCRMLGYSRDELLRLHAADIVAQTEIQHIGPTFDAVKAKSDHHREWQFRRKDGSVFDTDVIATVMPDGNLLGMVRDITESKQAEQAIRDSHARLVAILNSMYPFVGLLSRDGIVLEVNRPPLEAAGLTREDVIGKACLDVYWFSYSPEVQSQLRDALARAALGETVRYDVPIRVADNRFITIDVMFGPLRDSQGQVVQIVGSAVDITARKQAEDSLAESHMRLQQLSRALIEVQETERRHLARELHDEMGQVLTMISVNLKGVKEKLDGTLQPRLEESIGYVDRVIQEVRSISLDLRPAMLDDLGLAAALRWYSERQAERASFKVELITESTAGDVPTEVRNACFRVAQEAVTNVVRHGKARQVRIELHQREDEVELIVKDDGIGFDVATARARAAQGKSVGVMGMQERVELLEGTFAIESAPGQGTTIRARFPLPTDSEESA